MLRKMAASLLSAALFASFSMPRALAAPTGLTVDRSASRVTMRFQRPGAASPRLLAGVLSAPSTAAPVAVAKAYLATRPEILGNADLAQLRALPARPLLRGSLVRHVQSVNGVDVLGGDVIVRIDEAGRVRWAAGSPAQIPAGFSTVPGLDLDGALAAVAGKARFGVDAAQIDRGNVRLLVDATRAPRLAYEIDLPGRLQPVEQLRVRIDAHTGAIISSRNMIQFGAAPAYNGSVFAGNPVKTPVLQQVSLAPWLDTSQSGDLFLRGPDVKVQNCVDQGQCTNVDIGMGLAFDVHVCTMTNIAKASTGGDFLDFGRPSDDSDPADGFSEVQMFFHVNTIYAFFRGLGFDRLIDQPLTSVVNLRAPVDFNDLENAADALCTGTPPVPTAGHQLFPFGNAAFAPNGALFGVTGGGIVFGQAASGDMAYDGDVVYHEFTHALMNTLTPDFGANTLDEFGEDPTTGGMNEGMSDYFSSAFLNDPDLGEYAAPALGLPAGPMRTLTNSKTCPASLWNETHEDGEPWGGALWDGRIAVGEANRAKYDQAVYNVVAALQVDDDQVSTSIKIAAEIEVLIGAPQADLALAAYKARGLEDDCGGRVISLALEESKQVLFVTGAGMGVTPAPAAVQFKIEVPEGGAKRIDLAIGEGRLNGGQPGEGIGLELLAKPGADPIRWDYSTGDAVSDATLKATVTCAPDDGPCSSTIGGDFAAGPVVLQFQAVGAGAILLGTSFTTSTEPGPDAGPGSIDAGLPDSDAGPGVDAGGGGGDVGEDDDDGGCGCRAGGSSTSSQAATLLMLGLAFLPFFRRRK
jgi:MYXO-CTERM domain-containing protein